MINEATGRPLVQLQVVLQASVVVSPDALNFLPSDDVLVDELEQGQVGNFHAFPWHATS